MPPQGGAGPDSTYGAPSAGGAEIQALLAQLGGGQDSPPQDAPIPQGNWLVEAINAVHEGMSEETDPEVVSKVAKVQDLLTTLQALLSKPQAPTGG